MNLRPTYIYTINCPLSGLVVYVGKAVDPGKRLIEHCTYNCSVISTWLKVMQKMGHLPKMNVIDVTYSSGYVMERQYIDSYKAIGQACHNVKCNEDTRKSISSSFTGTRKTDYHPMVVERKRQIMKNLHNRFFYYKGLSNEQVDKMPAYAVEEIYRLFNGCFPN